MACFAPPPIFFFGGGGGGATAPFAHPPLPAPMWYSVSQRYVLNIPRAILGKIKLLFQLFYWACFAILARVDSN